MIKYWGRVVSVLLIIALVLSSVGSMPVKAEENQQVEDGIDAGTDAGSVDGNSEISSSDEVKEGKTEDEIADSVDETEEDKASDEQLDSRTEEDIDIVLQDENSNSLEQITGVDEEGNVYEVSDENGLVENPNSMLRAATGKIVNFNTKGSLVTNYKEVETGTAGYTCGAYGADAAYLGTVNGKVKFMLAGVIGEVDESEVQLVDISQASSISYYTVSSGRLIHKITGNVSKNVYANSLDNGPAPSYLQSGTAYYSYDGHYFYTYDRFSNMLSDYGEGVRTYAVNPNSPYFNYFQYLPLRSKTNQSATALNSVINNKTTSDSKMRDIGTTLVNMQNTYGVNALLMASVAANESAWGSSNIAKNKNNLFGLNAVDSSPGVSANQYNDVTTCIKDFAETYMSKRYLRSGYTYYRGGFLGNKASGINVSYASDPYWGEKAASLAWTMEKAGGSKDYAKYTIGIKDLVGSEHTNLNVRKESSTTSTVLYKTVPQSQYAFLILNNGATVNGFYKVQSDPVLNSSRTGIDTSTGNYNFSNMYAYVSKDYVTLVQNGSGGSVTSWKIADPVKVPGSLKNALSSTAYVAEIGWLDSVGNGEQVGTTGISTAMEALKLSVNNISGLGIEYCAHVSNVGWQSYVANGTTAGVTGKNIEAVKIRLTGVQKDEYDIYYRAHVSGTGWQSYVSTDEIAGTTGQKKPIEAVQIVLVKKEKDVSSVDKTIISYSTYNQILGWGGAASKNGEQSGTVGMSLPIESLKINSNLSGLGVEYATYIPIVGWQGFVSNGAEAKVTNNPKRIEAIKVRLTGSKADNYDIYYRVHSANYGWLGWAKNGAEAGTKGYACQIEAIQIAVVNKGAAAPGTTSNALLEKPMNVVYSSYVNGVGWQNSVKDGAQSGTTGQSKALGGIKINLENKLSSGSVVYSGHIQDIGWDSWKQEGAVAGTANGTKRLEAVKIQLTGELADVYDIYYRTYVQNFGWLGWAKNGAEAGTEAYGYRVEAIQIKLVKKGEAAPGSTENCFKKKVASVSYSAHVQNIGWQSFVADGVMAGTSGKSLRMEALKIKLTKQKYSGDIKYSTHVQDIGWQPFVTNGAIGGTVGKGKRVEAVKIQLTGEIANYCDVYYRVHIQGYGWLAWTKNGQAAGSEGLSRRVEAIEIKIVTKGETAPSTSGTAFYNKK